MDNPTTPSEPAALFLQEARVRLDESVELIIHCVSQLDDAQLWWRPGEGLNSIANLLLHLAGNLRQRFQTDVGGGPDVRDRFGEFTERGGLEKGELLRRFEESVSATIARLDSLTVDDLLTIHRTTRLAGEVEKSAIAIVFQALTHLAGHAQEIVFMTRLQLGDRYAFRTPDGVPPALRPSVRPRARVPPMKTDDMPVPTIAEAVDQNDLQAVRVLLSAYAAEFDALIRLELERQGFQAELDGLPGRYGGPAGALLLAWVQDQPAGCVALRALGEGDCEMKRLYVAPAFRSIGLGGRLVAAILDHAERLGYKRMLLDSTPEMSQAVDLYRRFGFRETAPYGESTHTIFFEKSLSSGTNESRPPSLEGVRN